MAEYTPNDTNTVERRSSSGFGWLIALVIVAALVVAAFAFGLVNVDQISSGKAPGIKVETTAGEAPVFDVQTARIDIGKKQETVQVPTVDVGSKDKNVTVPTVSIDRVDNPDAKDK
jgi:hypothetical protein